MLDMISFTFPRNAAMFASDRYCFLIAGSQKLAMVSSVYFDSTRRSSSWYLRESGWRPRGVLIFSSRACIVSPSAACCGSSIVFVVVRFDGLTPMSSVSISFMIPPIAASLSLGFDIEIVC